MEYNYNDMGDNMDDGFQPSLEQMDSLSNQVGLAHNS